MLGSEAMVKDSVKERNGSLEYLYTKNTAARILKLKKTNVVLKRRETLGVS